MRPVEEQSYDVRESQYFQGLPAFLQESIIQSAGSITNDEELRATAEKMMFNSNFQ